MQKWEYKTVYFPTPSDEHLNELGQDGWELCAIFQDERTGCSPKWRHTALLKRPIESEISRCLL